MPSLKDSSRRLAEISSLCLVLTVFSAYPAYAQLDPDDDPNEYDNPVVFTTPVISEFMASNGSKEPLAEGGLLDEDGDSSDWIEMEVSRRRGAQSGAVFGGLRFRQGPGRRRSRAAYEFQSRRRG
jgi:hypothetical protein